MTVIEDYYDDYDPANGVTMECAECGSTWPDDGRGECPICGSTDFDKMEEEDIADDSEIFDDSD